MIVNTNGHDEFDVQEYIDSIQTGINYLDLVGLDAREYIELTYLLINNLMHLSEIKIYNINYNNETLNKLSNAIDNWSEKLEKIEHNKNKLLEEIENILNANGGIYAGMDIMQRQNAGRNV